MESVKETTGILMGFALGLVMGFVFAVFVVDMLGLGLNAIR